MTHQRAIPPIQWSRWFLLAIVCALVFVADLVCIETGATDPVDRFLDRSLHSTFGPHSSRFFELMSTAGSGAVRVVIIALIVLGLAIIRYWWSVTLVIVATGGAALLDAFIKLLVGRPRPQLFPHLVSAGGSSFPSGHATNTCCVAVAVAYLVWHLSGRRGLTIMADIILLACVILVGLSRLVLGVHYPTDVVGGYALGAAWAALAIGVFAPGLHAEASRGAGRSVPLNLNRVRKRE